jgi:hypothetical protein
MKQTIFLLQVPAIPRIFYFALSNVLVLLVLANSAYVAHLLQQGNLKHNWPVRILRILVAGNQNMRIFKTPAVVE